MGSTRPTHTGWLILS